MKMMLILFTEIFIVTFINDCIWLMIYYIYNFIVEVAVCQPFYLINEYVVFKSVIPRAQSFIIVT